MKYISQKQNKEITIHLINVDNENEYQAQALADNGDIMGSISFLIKRKDRLVWLRKIETRPEYQHQGVGQALLDTLEYFTIQKRLCMIEGKFYPDNEFARPFYIKNNYSIDKDGYDTFISKYLSHDKIADNLQDRFVDFEILPAKELDKEL